MNKEYADQLAGNGMDADRDQMAQEDHEDEELRDEDVEEEDEDIEQEGTESESRGDTEHCGSEQVRRDEEDLLKRESLGELSQGDDLEIENHSEDENESLDSHDKLQNLLNEINDTCIESLKNDETENALETLKRAEQILEDFTNEGKDVDRNMIIIILYNQACCYQRLSMLEDCSNYLDGTIFNLQQKLISFEDQDFEISEMIN